jgi:hypothetical protein
VETHVYTAEPDDTYTALERNKQQLASELGAMGLHMLTFQASVLVWPGQLWGEKGRVNSVPVRRGFCMSFEAYNVKIHDTACTTRGNTVVASVKACVVSL